MLQRGKKWGFIYKHWDSLLFNDLQGNDSCSKVPWNYLIQPGTLHGNLHITRLPASSTADILPATAWSGFFYLSLPSHRHCRRCLRSSPYRLIRRGMVAFLLQLQRRRFIFRRILHRTGTKMGWLLFPHRRMNSQPLFVRTCRKSLAFPGHSRQ